MPITPEQLISQFARLRGLKTPKTFLELAGYPHYENVCSNLLSFYLDPGAEHGMGDLLLRALMECAGIEWKAPIHETKPPKRESTTEKGGRLDLLVQTEEFIIGVENKIWASLHNDLHDYAAFVTKHASEAGLMPERCYRIVLSVRDLSAEEHRKAKDAKFIVVRFSQLIGAIRPLFGQYMPRANLKHVGYFSDLMQTLENLSGTPNSDLQKFFASHGRDVEELNKAYWDYRSQLIPEVQKYAAETELNQFNKDEVIDSIYQKTTLITHVRCRGIHKDQAISIDLTTSSENWQFVLFSRGFSSYKFTDASNLAWNELSPKLLEMLGTGFQRLPNGNLQAQLPADLNPSELAKQLADVVIKVRAALGYSLVTPII